MCHVSMAVLFNIYMDVVMREVKGKLGEVGVRMYDEGRKWVLNSILFAAADDDDEERLQERMAGTTAG